MIRKNLPPAVRQKALEAEMRGLGILQYRRMVQRARQREREGATRHGAVMIKTAIDRIADGIGEFLKEATKDRRGVMFGASTVLGRVDPHVAALVALRVVIDALMHSQPLAALASKVGRRLEDEIRFQCFRQMAPGRFRKVKEEVKRASSYRHKRTVTTIRGNRAGIDWPSFTQADRLRAGMKLIDLIIERTGYIEARLIRRRKNKQERVIIATREVKRWVADQTARTEVLCPRYLPSYLPPRPWNKDGRGGYHYPQIVGDHFLVKTRFSEHQALIMKSLPDMGEVLEAVNTLQATPWAVNARVLAVANEAWLRNLSVDSLPPRDDLPLPPKPADIATNDEARKEWRRRAFPIHDFNKRALAKRLLVARTLWTAEQFAEEPAIYFPNQLDFRSREYAMPTGLSPQGSDLSKGLLQFAEGAALDTDEAAGWLAIHGANCYGYDKAPLEERIAFIEAMNHEITAIAADPLSVTSWTRADSPFQFLAFCFEWAEFLRVGPSFVSRQVVAQDASCSGIQHFSAMARDGAGAAAVNLVASETKADIYQRVCDHFIESLRAKLSDTDGLAYRSADGHAVSNAEAAWSWLTLEPDRSTTKQPVMTMPYGATQHGYRDQLIDWLADKHREGAPIEPGDIPRLAQFGASILSASISATVVGAARVMEFLKDIARVMSLATDPLCWYTPLGFPVFQHYTKSSKAQVRTSLGDVSIRLNYRKDLLGKNSRDMLSSIAPNFVHSLDATHLFMVTNLAADNGIKHLSAVHDSFGCHAAHANKFAAIIREAFVDLYAERDVLEEFRLAIKAQLPPELSELVSGPYELGSFDVSSVRESQFFFS